MKSPKNVSKFIILKRSALIFASALVSALAPALIPAKSRAATPRPNPTCEMAFSRIANPDFSNLKVESKAFIGSSQAFVPTPTWLTMTLPYTPLAPLLKSLEKRLGYSLISRGEAHITVLTPPEFLAMKSLISIDEINAIALSHGLQSSAVTPLYLGRGQANLFGLEESTYYVVVSSPNLLEIRRAIANEFSKRGGARDAFDPELYYPHVTIGFTKRDLVLQDGVVKNRSSFLADLKID